MHPKWPMRCGAAAVLLCGAAGLWGQAQAGGQPSGAAKPSAAVSTLPASQPTGTAGHAEAAPPAPPAPHHVEVSYAGGKLAVEATNASLNEILREVSQKTGMKITGGVADDRVFGSYGPSSPSVVLDALLEGTGSNILLVDDAKGGSELILSPRHGGVTPPNPNAGQTNESEDTGGGGYVPPVRPFQPPVANGRVPVPNTQVTAPGSDSPDASGTKTPQEIYEQLQQTMQQQRHLGSGSTPPQ